jgi:phenylacetate-CoA ligase
LIGFERLGDAGYHIHGDRYVQICDPETGAPVSRGEPGEIVVTTLARGWPMIRFGTGDVSSVIENFRTVAQVGSPRCRAGLAQR